MYAVRLTPGLLARSPGERVIRYQCIENRGTPKVPEVLQLK